MQTESISPEKRKTERASREAANGALKEVFVEHEFFLDCFSLRAQFDWIMARQGSDRQVQAEATEAGVPTLFRSPAERVFKRDGMIDFLRQLRKEAAGRLRARHASTPQIVVFRRGSHAWREQDATIAPWRYMYFLGPRGARTSMLVVIQTREVILQWFPWLTRTVTTRVLVESNDLILYPSNAVQSLQYQPIGVELKDQTVVLSGWLW
jgi:hypothetical protein